MNEPIGLILVRANKITRAQLYDALREQRATGQRLGDILYSRGWIGEEEMVLLLAKQLDMDYVPPAAFEKLPHELVSTVPAKVASDYHVVPVKVLAKNKLVLAMEDHRTRQYVDEISYLVGFTCVPALASPRTIRRALASWYGIDLAPPPPPVPRQVEDEPAPPPRVPPETLERPPEQRVDAMGRGVVATRSATGDEQVYLLTDLANTPTAGSRAAPQVVAGADLVRMAGLNEPAEVAESDETGKLRKAPRPAPVPALAPNPAPAPSRVASPSHADEVHDQFLSPDVDDKPLFVPKKVGSTNPPAAAAAIPPAPSMPEPTPLGDFDIVRAAERLFECKDPEAVGRVIVAFARHLIDRVIVFDVSGPRYRVLARAHAVPEDDRASEFTGNPEDLVLLGAIAQSKQPAYGPTPPGEMYDKFFDSLGFMRPPFILLYPLVVGDRTRAVLFGGLAKMRPPEEFGDLQILFKEASTALELIAT